MKNANNRWVGVWLACLLAIAFFANGVAYAAPTFPPLTGRVVDNANIIPAEVETQLDAKLAQIETESSDQIVVVTLPSLEGYEIEEYGYRLGREWAIGQKKLNNGLLLIVAPNERKVRIEIGYGLEGVMPDGLSAQIIRDDILPRFKAGDMPGGIVAGVDGIDKVLRASPEERAERLAKAPPSPQANGKPDDIPAALVIIIMVWIFLMVWQTRRNRFRRRRYNNGIDILPIILNDWDDDDRGGGGGFFGGGGSFGGGFGGGGGSFGGGGSSGSW